MAKALTLTQAQQETVLMVADAEMAAVMAISFHCGARVSTLAAMRWDWFVDAGGSLVPVMSVSANGVKGGQAYTVRLSDNAFLLIEALWIEQDRPASGPVVNGSYRSLNQRQDGISPDALRKRIKALYQACGLKASSHSGRRTCANRLLMDGATAFQVQAQLGHRSISSTVPYVMEASAASAAQHTKSW